MNTSTTASPTRVSPVLSTHARYTIGLLLLTASTGVVDAVSYLALDHVFTGNMTGNVLFLGFALLGAEDIPLLNNALALGGFVLGAIIGGRIVGRGHPRELPWRSVVTLSVGGALVIAIATAWMLLGHMPEPVLLTATALLAAVMGAQVSSVKPIGNSDVTTVVVTSTLANLSRESRLAGGVGQPWLPRLLAVLAMGLGGALGTGVILLVGGAAALYAGIGIYLVAVVTLIVVRVQDSR